MKHIFTISLCFLALSLSVYGQNNYSMSFDGVDDYVSVNGMGGTYSTFSFLTKARLVADNFNQSLFYFGQESTSNNSTGSIDLTIDDINYDPAVLRINLNFDNGSVEYQPLTLNSWVDVAGVFDGVNQMLYMYIEGQLVSSTSTTVSEIVLTNNDSHKIGAGFASANQSIANFFNGDIYNLAFFDKTLSQQEIQQYMNCPPSGDEAGLVGYWNFDEGSGTTAFDQTAHGNDGTINGATYSSDVPMSNTSYTDITACDSFDWNGLSYSESGTYSYSGANNTSISFDGFENHIQINNISNYNFDSFTLGCWFKQDAAANGFEMIMGKDCPGCENINGDWGVFVDNGTVRFFAQNTLSFNWGNVCNYSGISDENWHFIVATRNGSTGLLRLFIDGVEVDSKIDFTGLINNIEPVFIGKYYAGASDFTTSFYSDNFMMWNTELTGQEIQQYMDCPPVGDEQGLVGYWNFEEGQETIAYDQTANANNGTIHGATYDTSVPFQSCGLTNINGCDSTAVINLTLLPCSGEEVSTFCGEGTVWDSETQECIVAIPTDTNFDGCTDLNDLLDILSAYGDCAMDETNYSLNFDGVDDYVDLGNSYDYDFSNSPLSIMCWVNINNNSWIDGIVSKCTSSNLGWWLGTVSNDPTWANPNTFTFSGAASSGNYFSTNSPIILNDWVFLSAMYINGEQKLYINGILVDQSSHQYNLYNSATNLLIGKKTGDNNYDGLMDNISIWNSALTQEQIQFYMSTPPTGNEAGLVGYWDFNEGTGSTLTDKTSNGNDGVINGATWSTDVPTAP